VVETNYNRPVEYIKGRHRTIIILRIYILTVVLREISNTPCRRNYFLYQHMKTKMYQPSRT